MDVTSLSAVMRGKEGEVGMNFRDTIIHVLNQIASDKRMQKRADYWARICGEAATLLKQDERAIERAMELQPLEHINMPSAMNNTNVLMKCPFCGSAAKMVRDGTGSYKIFCVSIYCDAQMGWCMDADLIADEWNRRANDD